MALSFLTSEKRVKITVNVYRALGALFDENRLRSLWIKGLRITVERVKMPRFWVVWEELKPVLK